MLVFGSSDYNWNNNQSKDLKETAKNTPITPKITA